MPPSLPIVLCFGLVLGVALALMGLVPRVAPDLHPCLWGDALCRVMLSRAGSEAHGTHRGVTLWAGIWDLWMGAPGACPAWAVLARDEAQGREKEKKAKLLPQCHLVPENQTAWQVCRTATAGWQSPGNPSGAGKSQTGLAFR